MASRLGGSRLTATGERKRKRAPNSRKPKHQNAFAFRHNPRSKKTDKIKALVHGGLCNRCNEKIVWKKKYRKYKPLTKPRKCNKCQELTVKKAYHTICTSCAGAMKVCAWCAKPKDIVMTREIKTIQNAEKAKKVDAVLGDLKERKKRTLMRKFETGALKADQVIEQAEKALEQERMKEDMMFGFGDGMDMDDDF
eukprot:g1523.t1